MDKGMQDVLVKLFGGCMLNLFPVLGKILFGCKYFRHPNGFSSCVLQLRVAQALGPITGQCKLIRSRLLPRQNRISSTIARSEPRSTKLESPKSEASEPRCAGKQKKTKFS